MNTVSNSTVKPSKAEYLLRQLGYNRYIEGHPYESCKTKWEREGYLAANKAEAMATMPTNCAEWSPS